MPVFDHYDPVDHHSRNGVAIAPTGHGPGTIEITAHCYDRDNAGWHGSELAYYITVPSAHP